MTSLYREPEAREEVAPAALELVDVFKIYRSGPAETVALRGLDLRIEPGEFVAVYGPSGSGKSTMLRLACGLEQPSAGEVRAFGQSLTRLAEDELADYRARKIAIVFQTRNLWPELTSAENVDLALALAGRQGDPRAALGEFGLEGAAGRLASVLSGGEQQRVAIAAAAAREAPLVLADEPTAELDEANEQRVLDSLHRLRNDRGTTVVVVTHSPSVAGSADRVVEIRDGKVQR
ncbi:MAG: putative transport system ATP-binding protein [Gaiellaceae bacterium]|jgi:putative ABC transport system ATP-binding protein|nr:putative transport system ATP-binding protein [Gaiellaceae bacterium]